ncbi:MAG: type II secretion system secretin GspD [Gammaproteobacteria bacterium]|nr:type II secretion system secretin GspD [Gammaproteobacteria bacterium]
MDKLCRAQGRVGTAGVLGMLLLSSCATLHPPAGREPIPLPTSAAAAAQAPQVLVAESGPIAAPGPAVQPPASQIFGGTGAFIGAAAAPPIAASGEGTVTLNFQNQAVSEVVKAILGDNLGLNYMINDAVVGTISMRTVSPVTREALIPVLDSVLRMNGAALLKNNDFYEIVPIDDNLVGLTPSTRLSAERGYQILVVPLRFISARDMAKILEPVKSGRASVQLDDYRNLLILGGTQSELFNLRDTIQTFDVDQMAGTSVGLFRLSHVDATTMVTELNQLLGIDTRSNAEQTSPLAGMVRFSAIERINAVLAISPQRRYIEEVEQWIRRLDQAGPSTRPDGLNMYVYHLQHGDAEAIATLLNQLFDAREASQAAAQRQAQAQAPSQGAPAGGQVRGATGASTAPATPAAVRAGQPAAGGGLTQQAFVVPGPGGQGIVIAGNAPAQQRTASPQLSAAAAGVTQAGGARTTGQIAGEITAENVAVIADVENNALLIMASATDYAQIEQAIRKLDVQPLQVLVEATIVEVSLSDDLQYGLQWFVNAGVDKYNSTFGMNIPNSGAVTQNVTDQAGNIVGTTSALAGALTNPAHFTYRVFDAAATRAILNAIASDARLRVLSSPSMMVLDNHEATIQVGNRVPVRTSETANTAGVTTVNNQVGTTITSQIQYIDTGVTLQVLPRVNSGGMVVMEIRQEVNDASKTDSSDIDSPTILQRLIETSVAVQSGETLVLGGLIRDDSERTKGGIPFLKDLPVAGLLFSGRRETRAKTELVVLITPTAVSNTAEARAVTDEYKRKLEGIEFQVPER